MGTTDETPGGLGGEPPHGIRDTRLYERAIRERWPMSPAVRAKVLKRLCAIVDEDTEHAPDVGTPGHREVISAARALITADKLNIEQEKLDRSAPPDDKGDAPPPRLIIPAADDRPRPDDPR